VSGDLFDELMGSIVFTPDEEFIKKLNKNSEKIEKEVPTFKEPDGEPSF